jgi:hypothetical protein
MHNGRLADPLYEFTRELKKVSGKRKKTDADFEEMSRIEWYGGLYLNEKGEIFVTPEMVESALKEAARRERKGKTVDKSLVCLSTTALDIGVKKSVDELWKDPNYRLIIAVRIKGSRVMRTRPRFDKWSFEARIQYDEFALEERDILSFAQSATFGDWRPKFGQQKPEII